MIPENKAYFCSRNFKHAIDSAPIFSIEIKLSYCVLDEFALQYKY